MASSARALASGVAAAPHRRDDLLDQTDLAVRGGLERTQVPGLEAERGHLRRRSWRSRARRRRSGWCRGRGCTRPNVSSCSRRASSISAPDDAARRARAAARRARRTKASAAGKPSPATPPGDLRSGPGGRGRLEPAVDRVEVLLDDLQRQVVVALAGQHVAQPLHVGGGRTCGSPTGCARARPGPRTRGTGSWRCVTSGKSGRSSARTSPMLIRERDDAAALTLCCLLLHGWRRTPAGTCRSGPRPRPGAVTSSIRSRFT